MIFFRKPVPTPHQVRGRLFRDHALDSLMDGLDQWQGHCEGRTRAERALDAQASPVPIEDVLDECQAEPGASFRPALSDVHTIEALGEARQVLRSNARTPVAHRNLRLAAVWRLG